MLNDFSFQNPTRILFGKNAINKLASELKAYGQNILLVYGKAAIKKIGLYDQVINILQAEGKHVVELAGINANPRYTQLLEGARLVREHKIDLILAVGGGSEVTITPTYNSGTKIADYSIDGEPGEIYIPNYPQYTESVLYT